MDQQTLGKRLQAARQRAGLTQQELCQEAGLAYSTLAKIERGAIASPSVFTVAAIASATNTPLEELLDGFAEIGENSLAPRGKKTSKTGVSFVYFDVGGTLISPIQPAFTQIARDCGQSVETVEMFFWRHHDSVATGHSDLADFNNKLGDYLGMRSFDWQKYHLRSAKSIGQAQSLLKWAAEHYRVGLLTNNMPGGLAGYHRRHLLPELNYEAIIDSSEVGVLKPDPRIYQIAREKAGIHQSGILLVDNEKPNLLAAEQAGWQTAWFDDTRPTASTETIKKLLEF
jgi:FMN phosphatase YigB (HAD superfamily)/DNA-binding XRE family transcriptional regulator